MQSHEVVFRALCTTATSARIVLRRPLTMLSIWRGLMSRYESTIFHHRSLPKDAIYARYITSTMDFRRTLRSWSNNISQGSQRRIRAQSQGVLFQQTKQQRLEVRIFQNLPLVSIKRLIHLLDNRLIKQTLTVHWQRLLTKLIKVNWGARSKDFKSNASLIETQFQKLQNP